MCLNSGHMLSVFSRQLLWSGRVRRAGVGGPPGPRAAPHHTRPLGRPVGGGDLTCRPAATDLDGPRSAAPGRGGASPHHAGPTGAPRTPQQHPASRKSLMAGRVSLPSVLLTGAASKGPPTDAASHESPSCGSSWSGTPPVAATG